jgi:hypothetical protein
LLILVPLLVADPLRISILSLSLIIVVFR